MCARRLPPGAYAEAGEALLLVGVGLEIDVGVEAEEQEVVGAGGGDEGTGAQTLDIPAFGIVLNALQTNAAVNIVSTPNILTMDNEEAKIVVGRNVPFPVGQTQTSIGVPLINFQRADVAITLKVTPQINESDYVTLETFLEIQEIEGDIAGTAESGKLSASASRCLSPGLSPVLLSLPLGLKPHSSAVTSPDGRQIS